LDSITDSRAYWSTIRKLNGNSFVKSMEVNADVLGKHFRDLLATQTGRYRKAPGNDRIPSEFIKYATPQFKASLLTAFNKFLGSKKVPKSFQKAIIVPIFKKGDPKVTSNYRGISFQNALAKVFSALLLERLKNWVNTTIFLLNSMPVL